MNQPKRILLVGLGSIGQRHLRLLRYRHPDADIRVLRHRQVGDAPGFANGFFYDVGAALDFSPECAVIANPAPFHLAIARQLAEKGCHLLIEKPLSACSQGIIEFKEIVERSGVIVQVGYNLRFLPSLQEFRRLLNSEIVGQVFSVRCEIGQYLPSWRPGTDFKEGVSAQKDLGGGVLLELSHELDYLSWIFGNPSWVSAWTGQLSGLALMVEDTAHLTIGFADERRVAALNMDFSRHDTTRQCLAIGTAGTLRWNAITGTVERFSPTHDGWEVLYEHHPARDESYRKQWECFLQSIQSGIQPEPGIDAGAVVVRMVEAAKMSAANSGKQVGLPSL